MKYGSDGRELADLERISQHGYGFIANNASKLVAFLTAAVAVVATFADVAFEGFGGVEFTVTLAVMVIASYLIHFSLEETGERYGDESEEYKAAMKRYMTARASLRPEDMDELRIFLSDYSDRELYERRRGMLFDAGISYEDYEAFLAGGVSQKATKRLFRRVSRLKAVRLTPGDLLSTRAARRENEFEDPEARKVFKLFLGMLPTTVCMFFTVSVVLNVKDGLTPSTIADGIFKLSTLPIIGFRGYIAGYKHSRGVKADWLESKARLLESFSARAK